MAVNAVERLPLVNRPVGWILLRGVLSFFGSYFLAGANTSANKKARASRGVWGHASPGNFANLGSLKCHFLHFDIISEVGMHFHSILALPKVIIILKRILKCSEMSVCI